MLDTLRRAPRLSELRLRPDVVDAPDERVVVSGMHGIARAARAADEAMSLDHRKTLVALTEVRFLLLRG